MWQGFPIYPDQASTIAQGVDHLHFFLTGITLFFTAIIFTTIFYFAVKYRRRSEDEKPPLILGSLPLELAWTLIPLALTVIVFVWSSSLYFRNARPPAASMEIFVVGKQWMWVIQHPEGPREINELHVPVGRPVKLTMTSQDVIHDFYIPAFRVKRDVLPGRYSSIWFQATKTGQYHLFCAQYCGAMHAAMGGWVYVMTPADYEQWLSGGAKGESMAAAGNRLFGQYGCVSCHIADGTGRGPVLQGVFGHPVKLQDGRTVVADEAYVRESILNPGAKIVAGYSPIMPTFQGQISEEQVLQLIAYIKSLGTEERKPAKP
ncbi:MAG TPA: cytochrome c oxidase subunit II [Terriglobia bacterium]|jgi:cytochrome c oxidase subunit 2|nr:cytochrome c oxidase subunit II [Terriglobia bacterium]